MAAKTMIDLFLAHRSATKTNKELILILFDVKVLITSIENSVRISQFKMAANMAAKHIKLYISGHRSAIKTNNWPVLIYSMSRV